MNNLTILIPIGTPEINVDQALFERMFESLSKQDDKEFNVVVATFESLKPKVDNANIYNVPVEYLFLPEELKGVYPNYTEVINFAVHSISTPYFSVLQYDDALNNTYVKFFKQYAEAYPEVSVFVPISLEFDGGNFTRCANEAVWNIEYTEKQGYLDFETVKKAFIFSFVGAAYKTDGFIANNGFKHSIKKYFEYEYFLRILYNLEEVMVIPRFMVSHTINRENSLSRYYDDMEQLESKFYQDLARKEYYFAEDRTIEYKPSAV